MTKFIFTSPQDLAKLVNSIDKVLFDNEITDCNTTLLRDVIFTFAHDNFDKNDYNEFLKLLVS